MTRPKWATVVGIIGIIVGCFGILGGGQLMMMPRIVEMQKQMFSSMEESIEEREAANPRQMPPRAMFQTMEKMWDVPDWFDTYCVVAGIAALCVSGFYLFASIRLLQTKPTAIKLFYAAAGIAIGFTIVRAVVAMAATSFMGIALMAGGAFGLVINVVLLIVVATGDKEAFTTPEAGQPT